MHDWPVAPFESLFAVPVRNGLYKPKEYHGRGVKIVNMGELFAHPRLMSVDMKRVEISSSELSRFALMVGDLIFARRSLTAEGAGKCSIIMEVDEDTTYESSIIRARLNKTKADPLYFFYFFQSPQGAHLLDTIRRQVAVAGITGGDLSSLIVPVPDIGEQRAISHILRVFDDKIDLNRRMNETLEAMARAIFKDWFVDFGPVRAKMEDRDPPGLQSEIAALFPDLLDDDGLPEGWETAPISKVIDFNPSERLQSGVIAPYLDMAALPTSGSWPAEPISRAFTSGTRFRSGDTLLARITPCLENGKAAYIQGIEGVGWGSTEFIVMRPKPDVPHCYAYLFTRDPAFKAHAIRSMTGSSGRQRVQVENLSNFAIAVPPSRVFRGFGGIVEPWFDMIASNSRQSSTLAALRDLLLPRLMSGEIRIKDVEKLVEQAA